MAYLLIDNNSIGHAAANSPALHVDDQPVHAIFHSLKMLKRSMRELADDNPIPIALWDGKTYWRKEAHPTYKEKEPANTPAGIKSQAESIAVKQSYQLQRPLIVKALHLLGITQFVGHNFEADDLAGYLAQYYTKQGQEVIMLSGDKDWIQLVNSKCRWIDPIRKREVNKSNFEEFTGFATPRQYVEGKVLLGDKGDNIAGVDGIGSTAAPIIMQEFGSLQGLYDTYDSFEGEFGVKGEHVLPESLKRYRKKINALCESGREQAAFAHKLMNLLDVNLKMADVHIVKGANDGKGDFPAFKRFCEDLQFRSIIREMLVWEEIFGDQS